MTNAERNENFLKKAFALKQVNDISEPFVLGNNIVVLQYTTETTAEDEDININSFVNYDENAASAAILKSDKLENNFLSVYFENFMR